MLACTAIRFCGVSIKNEQVQYRGELYLLMSKGIYILCIHIANRYSAYNEIQLKLKSVCVS